MASTVITHNDSRAARKVHVVVLSHVSIQLLKLSASKFSILRDRDKSLCYSVNTYLSHTILHSE